MGQHAVKEQKEAVKARKRNAQTTSSTFTASDDSHLVPVATHVIPVTGITKVSAAVNEQLKWGRQMKLVEDTTLAHTTCSRSASTVTSKSITVDSIGTVSQAQFSMAVSDSDEASEQGWPVCKASTAVQTLLHRIALSNITEQTGSESSGEDQANSKEEYGEDDGSADVTDEVEVLEEFVEVWPKKTKAEHMRTSAMRWEAMKDMPMEESEAKDEDGEYTTMFKLLTLWLTLYLYRTFHIHHWGHQFAER